jgi:Protein of unknown function (DUF3617)
MHASLLRLVISIFVFAAAALTGQAQTTLTPPPLKPGLWEVHMEREINGQKQPDASERLKSLSPEKRAQYEAMMKRSGMATGADGNNQICYSRESLAKSPWTETQTDCKVTYSTRSSTEWKWHTSCSKMNVEADGEATFPNSENYTMVSSSVVKVGDTPRTSRTTMTGKWVGADCGDVKPFDAKP